MKDIYLTNTLTKNKELFTPINPGVVGMYQCGPTVYGNAHIGNLRSYTMGDIIRRVFEYNGYLINQVMNITDIGHLVSDGDDGDDKMTKGLKREGMEITLENMLKLARKYEEIFLADIAAMNILRPKIVARASEHIDEDIEIIKKLEEKQFLKRVAVKEDERMKKVILLEKALVSKDEITLIPFKLACSLGVDTNDLVAIHNLCHRFLKGLEDSKLESLSE